MFSLHFTQAVRLNAINPKSHASSAQRANQALHASRFIGGYLLVCALACAASASLAQSAPAAAGPAQCITAGRLADGGAQWAPRMAGVELLDASGQRVGAGNKAALATVRQVRLAQTALLSDCNGDKPLAQADGTPAQAKTEVPAVTADKQALPVSGVAYLKLRTGGELVEIKLSDLPANRVVMLKR